MDGMGETGGDDVLAKGRWMSLGPNGRTIEGLVLGSMRPSPDIEYHEACGMLAFILEKMEMGLEPDGYFFTLIFFIIRT